MDKNFSHDKDKEQKTRPMALTIKAVVLKDGQVLLMKRAKRCINPGKWDFPGGHVDVNETVEEALEREIREEANLQVQIGPIIRLSEFPKGHEQFKNEKRGVRYIAYYESGEVKLNEEEHSEYKWLSIDEAIEFLEDEGFEKEKKETLLIAKQYLQMQESLDGWKRALADMENYKKRMQKQNEDYKKYCIEDFVMELLPVVDNFEMATEHIPAKMENDSWVTGLMHIKNQLQTALKNRGIDEIEAKPGDEVDVNIHEVISGGQDGSHKIKKVIKKGYRIGQRVVRPVMVEAE